MVKAAWGVEVFVEDEVGSRGNAEKGGAIVVGGREREGCFVGGPWRHACVVQRVGVCGVSSYCV